MKRSNFDPVSVDVLSRQVKIAALCVLIAFGMLIIRLWYLQIVKGSVYRSKSEYNRIRLEDVVPFRGMIYDRNGKTLVKNRPSYNLYVIPEEVQDSQALLERLSALSGIDPKEAAEKLSQGAKHYPFKPVCLKRDISRDQLARIETHMYDLAGVMIKVKPQRHYCYGELASHLLGYLGEISEEQLRSGRYKDNKAGDVIGKTGIERRWQSDLNGRRGGAQVEVDAAGRRIRLISRKPAVSGYDIGLTIDKTLQDQAERALEGNHGAIVAMDPMNGEVLAMASNPSYDPNVFIKGMDHLTWRRISLSKAFPMQNRALTGQYPPGSVFKIVVALAGLQEGVITPEDEFYCSGTFSLGKYRYRCWKRYGHGHVNLMRALIESCDVYFYNLGKKLGVDKIAFYAKQLGLGKPTGIGLENEKSGLIPTREWKKRRWGVSWQTGETISTAIGQSFVLVTPIQMAVLMSAVFNGGTIYKPQVTRWVRKADGEAVFEMSPEAKEKLNIKPPYLEMVKEALQGVVNGPHGTGSKARLKNISVAGKTGTAQVVAMGDDSKRQDEADIPWKYRDHAWFVAVAPVGDPKIAVAVLVEHGGHGGSAAAPIAKGLIETYLDKGKAGEEKACNP
ncbi:MAG: penicillin-binding protein 2 [Deltaproteobacteria bacterium]|nr:penicillin-binding protein 2 [Deltaproteobacteria bacterium]